MWWLGELLLFFPGALRVSECLSRLCNSVLVQLSPTDKRLQGFQKRHSHLGEVIFDLGRINGVNCSADKAIFLQPPYSPRQNLLGDVTDGAVQGIEAFRCD